MRRNAAAHPNGIVIDQIQTEDPTVVVLLGTVGPATDRTLAAGLAAYNAQIRTLYTNLQNEGRKVSLADMSLLTASDLSPDGVTPNDTGFQKMAEAFDTALHGAYNNGWVQQPSTPGQHAPFAQQIAMGRVVIGDQDGFSRAVIAEDWCIDRRDPRRVGDFRQQ